MPSYASATPIVPTIGEPSFADVAHAVEVASDLTADKKRYWLSALRKVAVYLEKPPVVIPARIAAIRSIVAMLHPEKLGVHPKTFANHRANVRGALLWFNRQTLGTGRGAPVAANYRVLLGLIRDRHVRDVLSPFFRYLTGRRVDPDDVIDADVERFLLNCRETGFGKVTPARHRLLVRLWNKSASAIGSWPTRRLTEPPLRQRAGTPWGEVPAGLRADIDNYCTHLASRRKSANARTLRPCAASTIATRRRELIATVRAAIVAGIDISDLQRLDALLRPDRVEAIIDHYWRKNGVRPSLYTIDLASKLFALARGRGGITSADLERLDEIRLIVEGHRPTGLTDKNRELVRQVLRSGVWGKVMALPDSLMARARADLETRPARSSVTALLAVAIRLLVIAPIRMQNLGAIRIGVNLVRPGGKLAPYLLVFPDYDVKNRVPLEFPIDLATTELIDEYIHIFRPHLMRGRDHENLFPGVAQDKKATRGLAEQISARLWKELGLEITPHQFRHAAAAIMLQHDPGNYEWVRRVLGHRNIQTTINFYVGLETAEATRKFGEMIMAAEPAVAPRRMRGP